MIQCRFCARIEYNLNKKRACKKTKCQIYDPFPFSVKILQFKYIYLYSKNLTFQQVYITINIKTIYINSYFNSIFRYLYLILLNWTHLVIDTLKTDSTFCLNILFNLKSTFHILLVLFDTILWILVGGEWLGFIKKSIVLWKILIYA